MSTVGHPKSSRAFSLIELLVVIAVIAILAALLFPVFAKVREKARQATVISNMHQIQTGLETYKLDNHKYPDVLFGYAVTGKKMSDHDGATGGLYPNYVNDYRAFLDPNNSVDDPAAQQPGVSVYALDSTGKLTTTTKAFYRADAMDVSPKVTGVNAVTDGTYVPRYQPSWTNIDSTLAATACSPTDTTTVCNDGGNLYTHQLRWRSQPGDTYVTCSTYHVTNAGKVIVLFEDGPAKVIDATKFLALGDVDTLTAPTGAATTGNANFWKLRP